MGGVRSRKMDAETSQSNGHKDPPKNGGRARVNGLGEKAGSLEQKPRPSENIFLFYPNMIGMSPNLQLIDFKKMEVLP